MTVNWDLPFFGAPRLRSRRHPVQRRGESSALSGCSMLRLAVEAGRTLAVGTIGADAQLARLELALLAQRRTRRRRRSFSPLPRTARERGEQQATGEGPEPSCSRQPLRSGACHRAAAVSQSGEAITTVYPSGSRVHSSRWCPLPSPPRRAIADKTGSRRRHREPRSEAALACSSVPWRARRRKTPGCLVLAANRRHRQQRAAYDFVSPMKATLVKTPRGHAAIVESHGAFPEHFRTRLPAAQIISGAINDSK